MKKVILALLAVMVLAFYATASAQGMPSPGNHPGYQALEANDPPPPDQGNPPPKHKPNPQPPKGDPDHQPPQGDPDRQPPPPEAGN